MCLAKAFLKKGDKEELIVEHLSDIEVHGNKVRLSSLLGGHAEIAAVIRKVDFENGMVFLEAASDKRHGSPVNI